MVHNEDNLKGSSFMTFTVFVLGSWDKQLDQTRWDSNNIIVLLRIYTTKPGPTIFRHHRRSKKFVDLGDL